ncbi:hypothetical protein HPP92_013874 [Vanilla planifolia]|uniref:Uncharacterized protein n=1 Tax=Vanilla planifolia TaxID=51239 RepID=A0A835QZ31_VANPL|nr:hypothetical protein HPP92_013874 [Vanilla planifolia]
MPLANPPDSNSQLPSQQSHGPRPSFLPLTGDANSTLRHRLDWHVDQGAEPTSAAVTQFPTGRRLVVRATESEVNEAKTTPPNKTPASTNGSNFNQLLGIKGAAQESDKWKIRLQLVAKPVTWPPLVWGVLCGAAASGNFHWNLDDVAKSIVCMVMSGPFLQVIHRSVLCNVFAPLLFLPRNVNIQNSLVVV